MAWAYIASSGVSFNRGSNGSATASGALGAAVSVGDRVEVFATYIRSGSTAPATLTCTDNLGNSYVADVTSATLSNGTFRTIAVQWSATVTTGGTPTITCTHDGGGVDQPNAFETDFSAAAYSGTDTTASPVDVSVSTTGSSTTPASGATAATHAANELVVGGIEGDDAVATVTAGTGFTLRTSNHNTTEVDRGLEDEDSGASSSTPNATATLSSTEPWIAICTVYKLSGAAPPAATPPPLMRTLRGVGV